MSNFLNDLANNHDTNESNTHDNKGQESTDYLLPERDYPLDDDEDSASDSGSFIVHPTDNYKSHQIDPEFYEPPTELPPDTVSGRF